ncbi:cytochrome P450, partial [Linnemannia elongata AG-77]
LSSYVFYTTFLYPNYISPLRNIPGPPNISKHNKRNLPFLGLFFDVIRREAGVTFREWTEQYGGILCYKGLFNSQIIHLADPEAIHHVFNTHAYQYPKPDRVIRVMSSAIGAGLLLVEGDVHRVQRKMFTPAFSHKSIKQMVPSMAGPAECLVKMWEKRIDESETKSVEMNVFTDIASCTLDIIGLTGFGFDFEALAKPGNVVVKSIEEYFNQKVPAVVQLLRHFVPYYSKIPFRHNQVRLQCIRSVDEAARKIVCQKREKMATGKDDGKDLLSIMIRASESSGNDMLTDDDLRAQIKNFLAAGHDTSSVTVTWMLHVLSTRPEVQSKLRQEFLTHIGRPTDKTSSSSSALAYEALQALTYLNICIKELFRFIPPVPYTSRVASQDDNILGYDIPKGTEIQLCPATLHKLKSVWGEDAEEFKPERWMDPSSFSEEDQQSINFVTPDMMWAYMPFLTGPRSCIGSKLALIEIKVILYYLLIDLEYAPVPGFKVTKSARITMRPSPGMNLIIK